MKRDKMIRELKMLNCETIVSQDKWEEYLESLDDDELKFCYVECFGNDETPYEQDR